MWPGLISRSLRALLPLPLVKKARGLLLWHQLCVTRSAGAQEPHVRHSSAHARANWLIPLQGRACVWQRLTNLTFSSLGSAVFSTPMLWDIFQIIVIIKSVLRVQGRGKVLSSNPGSATYCLSPGKLFSTISVLQFSHCLGARVLTAASLGGREDSGCQ